MNMIEMSMLITSKSDGLCPTIIILFSILGILYKYDTILFNDNSFGIESLLMGVKSFEYEFDEIYPENRLLDFDLYNHRVDKKGLIKIRDNILNNSMSKELNQEYIQQYIGNMYRVYNGNINHIFN